MAAMTQRGLEYQDWQDLEDLRPFAEGLVRIAKTKALNTDLAMDRLEEFIDTLEEAIRCLPKSANLLEQDP